ncbi:hypothetical protein [Virgibacillus ainsalahensis]
MLIETYEADITGDGQNEVIELKGVLFSQDTNYFRDIWADITSPSYENEWKISYGGGYEPALQFIDLNHDNVKDIFYQSATGGSGGLYSYHLHTLKNDELTEIPLPQQPNIKAEFAENFNVDIQLTPNDKPITVDVSDRKNDYIRLGMYNEAGELIEPTDAMIDPIAFFDPVLISKTKGYGLKSYQQISGAYHADQLGTIETLWYYENEEWIILQTEWVPSN